MYKINSPIYIKLSQSEVSILIETLVKAIDRSDKPAFNVTLNRSGDEQVRETRLSKYFESFEQMINLFDERYPYSYSEDLQVFWKACGNPP